MAKQPSFVNKAYIEEVAAQLLDMKEGEKRLLPLPPLTLPLTNMFRMLEYRGWYRGLHYITGPARYDEETKERFSVDRRRRFFIKLKQSVAAQKLTPVDSM